MDGLTGGSRSKAATRFPSCSGTRSRRATAARPFARRTSASGARRRWREYGERARWIGMGLVKLGLKRGDVVSILAETVPEWLYADMGTMGAGGVTNGIYPTDSAKQVDYILERQPHALPVRRERGAARQVHRGARALPDARQGLRLRHGRPAPTSATRMVMPLDELLALGRAHDAAHPGPVGASASRLARPTSSRCWSTPRAPPARPRARCCRTATSSSSCATPTPSSRSAPTTSSSPSCRSATSPSAPSPSSCRCAPAPSPTSPRASRRCRRTCARWRRPPSSPCRASGSASIPASPSA